MSNIHTTFFRLFPRDGRRPGDWEAVARACMDAYGEHGSYWVRAAAAWRPEGWLDLRTGPAKALQWVYQEPAFLERWEVWRRSADEAGCADGLQFLNAEGRETCRYGFDALTVRRADGTERLVRAGTYTACNSHACVDHDDPRSSPRAPWIPGLDPQEPSPGAYLLACDDPLVFALLSEEADPPGPEILEACLWWRGRVVHRRAWETRFPEDGPLWEPTGADGWDNLVNPSWLAWSAAWVAP